MFYIAYELEKIYDNIKIYIEEYFNQLKHYITLDKPLEFIDIKRSIVKQIIIIIIFYILLILDN